jgi:hypothetical protein
LSTIALLLAICKVASFLVHVHLNSQPLQVKIAYWPLLPQHLLRYVMQPVNLRSCTAAKEISESVLQLLNVSLVFATLFQLAHR